MLAGTPQPIIDRLAKELSAILARPDVKEKFDKIGLPVVADGAGGVPQARRARGADVQGDHRQGGLEDSMMPSRSPASASSSWRISSPARCAARCWPTWAPTWSRSSRRGGDMSRATPPIRNGESVSFTALNRNKRSLVLDLKQPEAQEVMRKLAAKSDVFVEANRPGALEKMGLGAEAPESGQSEAHLHLGVRLRPDRPGPPARRRQPDHRGVLRRAVGHRRAGQDADAAGRADRRRVRRAVCDLRDAREPGRRRRAPAKAASPTCRWSRPRSPRRPGRRRNISKPARCRSRWATGIGSPRRISCSRRATSATSRSACRTTCCSRNSCR